MVLYSLELLSGVKALVKWKRITAMHENMHNITHAQTHMQIVASQRLIVRARRHPRIKETS